MARGKRPTLSQATESEIVSLFDTGTPAAMIALQRNMRKSSVYSILRRYGKKPADLQAKALMQRVCKITPDTLRDILSTYNTGCSLHETARRFGLSYSAVRKVISKAGVDLRPFGDKYADEQMVEEYNSGKSTTEISVAMGLSQSTVWRRLIQAGVKTRKRLAGEKHGNWKGGRTSSSGGYVWVTPQPGEFMTMRSSIGYVLEHRLVMARHFGRALLQNETVHHINGDRADNRLENLQLRIGKHGIHEAYRCDDCGSTNVTAVKLH